jgi:hypothetical protein
MASEIEKIELEKICADLEAKITAKNQELAELNRTIHARIDAGEGDLRLSKLVLEKEIQDLQVKKSDLAGTVTAALAEVTAEKMRVAGEAEKVKTAQAHLSRDQEQIVNQIHDVARREAALKEGQQKLNEDVLSANARLSRSRDAEAAAIKKLEEAVAKRDEADRLLKEAQEKQRAAENAVADLTAQANKKLKEAEDILAQAQEKEKSVAAQQAQAQGLIAEYTKKLEESQTWAMENSTLSDKLSSWEAALRNEAWKLQEDRAKLAIAERAFAAKNKGEN